MSQDWNHKVLKIIHPGSGEALYGRIIKCTVFFFASDPTIRLIFELNRFNYFCEKIKVPSYIKELTSLFCSTLGNVWVCGVYKDQLCNTLMKVCNVHPIFSNHDKKRYIQLNLLPLDNLDFVREVETLKKCGKYPVKGAIGNNGR